MVKKYVFLLLLMSIFMINFSCAAEFDNVKNYNEELRVVTITNAFGMGEVIGQARLISPLNVKVGTGYQKVAEFEIWAYDDYNDAVKQFTFTNMKNKEKINRDYDLKYFAGYKDVEVKTKGCLEYETLVNGSMICIDYGVNGSIIEQVEDWIKISPADLRKSDSLIIGVFTDVQEGDYVDWVPVIYGVEIEEWATWTQSLSVGLISYYNFNEASGDLIDQHGDNDATNNGITYEATGKINYSYTYNGNSGSGSYTDTNTTYWSGSDNFTISMWTKSDGSQNQYATLLSPNENSRGPVIIQDFQTDNSQNFNWYDGSDWQGLDFGYNPDTDTDWKHLVATKSGNTVKIYLNGSYVTEATGVTFLFGGPMFIGRSITANREFGGNIDEVGFWNRSLSLSEIESLWNGGDGLPYSDEFGTPPNVTLNSPVDNYNTTNPTIIFNATVEDANLTNVTFYLNGVANETNSSGINGFYIFTKSISQGVGNWSILACNNESLCNQSDTRTFNFTALPPTVSLTSPINYANLTSSTQTFIAEVTDPLGVKNVTFFINETIVYTSTSGVNGTYQTIQNIEEGYQNWSVLAYNIYDIPIESDTWFFNYTQPPLYVDLIVPIDNYNSSVSTVNMTCFSYSMDGVTQLDLIINGLIEDTIYNTTVAQNLTFSDNIYFGDGAYNWKCQATNDFTVVNSTQRTLTVDTTDPIVSITYPTTTTYTFNISSLNYTVSDSHKNKCWYSTDMGTTNSTPIAPVNFTGVTSVEGTNNWTVYCNDTFGNEGSDSVTFERDTLVTILNSPADDSSTIIGDVTFNAIGNSTIGDSLQNMSLWTNETGSWDIRNTTILFDSSFLDETQYSQTGTTPLLVKTYSNLGNPMIDNISNSIMRDNGEGYAEYKIFFIDASTSTYTINSTDSSGWFDKNISLSVGDKLKRVNYIELRLFADLAGRTVYVRNTSFNGLSPSEATINFTRYISNPIIWNVKTCLIDGKCNFAPNNFTLGIDITPPIVEIASPTGIIGSGAVGSPETLNFTATDANLDTCWYEYNGINTTVEGCTSGVSNSTTFILVAGQLSLTVWVNDTSGLLSSNTTTWEYFINDINITYDSPIGESIPNTITQVISVGGGYLLQNAYLDYNGTNYSSSFIYSAGNYIISTTAPAPDVTTAENISFRFVVEINSTEYQLRENLQLVIPLNFSVCGGGDVLLNISLYDEESLTDLNGNIEVNLDLISTTSLTSVQSLEFEIENESNVLVCLDPINSTEFFVLDAEIRYEAPDYAAEFYYMQSADLSSYPIEIPLFDLKLNDSTEFVITYQNDDFIFVEGAVIQLQRKYISDDTFETVEAPVTSDGGKAIVHVDLNSNIYQASVVKDGELLDIFEGIVFSCDNELSGDCEEKLEGKVDPNNDVSITELTDFSYTTTFDEDNNTVTVLFAVPSGIPSSINVVLGQKDTFGNLTSCNTTVLTSAGSITCGYSDTIEKSLLELKISKNNLELAISSYILNPDLDMDGMNFFIVFLFTISLVGMAISSPEWMMIIGVLVFIISGTLLLLNGMSLVMGLGAIAWLVVAVGIIITKMSKQEDR